jgi:hypothetical protein
MLKWCNRTGPFVPCLLIASLAPVITAGCERAIEGHPVSGVVLWSGGGLAGHHVDVGLSSDETTRAFGTIDSAGRFQLERYVAGKTHSGVPAGNYLARLILNDEGDGQTKKVNVPARYLDFKTSGWSIQVPVQDDVVLKVSPK